MDVQNIRVSIHDIHLRKPYKSSTKHNQQVVSRSTIPRCILKVYSQCEATPALDKLNPYREDGTNSMKFYTDPGYFFELWFQDMQKDIEKKKAELKDIRQNRPQKPNQQKKAPPQVQTVVEKYQDMKQGVEFSNKSYRADPALLYIQNNQSRPASLEVQMQKAENNNRVSRPPQNGPQYSQDVSRQSNFQTESYNYIGQPGSHHPQSIQNHLSSQQSCMSNMSHLRSSGSIGASRPSQPLPAPPLFMPNAQQYHRKSLYRDSLPPPPPPPPLGEDEDQSSPEISKVPITHRPSPAKQEVDLPSPPMSPEQNLSPLACLPPVDAGMAPPPPTPSPPPMPMTNGFDDESSSTGCSSLKMDLSASRQLKPTPKPQPVVDDRSNLLAQIRLGKQLRKVEEKKQERDRSVPDGNFDVHSIMNKALEMRRKVIKVRREEDGSSEEEWE